MCDIIDVNVNDNLDDFIAIFKVRVCFECAKKLFYQKIERLINNQKKEKEDENGLEKETNHRKDKHKKAKSATSSGSDIDGNDAINIRSHLDIQNVILQSTKDEH